MSYRVVYTDPQQHQLSGELLSLLSAAGAELELGYHETQEEIAAFCRDADAVMNSAAQITAPVIDSMTRCRVIARVGTGYDNIDVEAAARCGIPVTNVPNFCTEEVATHTIALLLACDRKIVTRDREMRLGEWNQFALTESGRRLAGRVLGLVGYGTIGQAVAKRAAPFGLKITYFDPHLQAAPNNPPAQRCASLEELIKRSDIVSLHVALTPETRNLIGKRELQLMKPETILVNTARGQVVDEPELIASLQAGRIAAAGLDVYEVEPLPADSPLTKLDNVVLSPHTSGHTEESTQEVRRRTVEEVVRALRGEPLQHVVNRDLLAS